LNSVKIINENAGNNKNNSSRNSNNSKSNSSNNDNNPSNKDNSNSSNNSNSNNNNLSLNNSGNNQPSFSKKKNALIWNQSWEKYLQIQRIIYQVVTKNYYYFELFAE
jgi:hypothetical protein